MKFRPNNDWVVVEPLPAEEKTAGGIIIPDTAKEIPNIGIIRAVGPGRHELSTGMLVPMQNKVGDEVSYGKKSGIKQNIEGIECLLMREADLFNKFVNS